MAINIEDFEDEAKGSIPSWMLPIFRKFSINSIIANFSGGGDSGQMDDCVFEKDGGGLVDDRDVHSALGQIKVRINPTVTRTGLEFFETALEKDAEDCGDYYNNEGGSVYLQYDVSDTGITLAQASLSEFDESDYDDEDYDDELDDVDEFDLDQDFEDDEGLEP